jgi:hypothetical protein
MHDLRILNPPQLLPDQSPMFVASTYVLEVFDFAKRYSEYNHFRTCGRRHQQKLARR